MIVVLLSASCSTAYQHNSGYDPVSPLSDNDRAAVGRIALRMSPPPDAATMVLKPGRSSRISSAATRGALGGAIQGGGELIDGFSDSNAPVVAHALLLPLAMAAGAITGALAGSVETLNTTPLPTAEVTTPPNEAIGIDALNKEFAEGIVALNIEPVDHNSTVEGLAESGYDSVIDVEMFQPVVTGRARESQFVLLHKMQITSLLDAFEPSVWYREQVSGYMPADDWIDSDKRAVQAQLSILQENLLKDLRLLLGADSQPGE